MNRRFWTLAIALLLLVSPAAAAENEVANASSTVRSAWDATLAAVSSGWAAITNLFGAPDPFDYLPEQLSPQNQFFLALMDSAGYRLAVIDTGGEVFARVNYRFVQERTASADDLDRG